MRRMLGFCWYLNTFFDRIHCNHRHYCLLRSKQAQAQAQGQEMNKDYIKARWAIVVDSDQDISFRHRHPVWVTSIQRLDHYNCAFHRIESPELLSIFLGFTVNYKLLFLKQTWWWWKAWFWPKASILLIIQSTTGLNSSILGWLGEHRWFSGGKGAMLPPQQVLLTPKCLWRIAKRITSKWKGLDLAPWWPVGWWYERRNIIQVILFG